MSESDLSPIHLTGDAADRMTPDEREQAVAMIRATRNKDADAEPYVEQVATTSEVPVRTNLVDAESALGDQALNAGWWKGRARQAQDERDELRAVLQAFVTFHSGHVLPPELRDTYREALKALGPWEMTQ